MFNGMLCPVHQESVERIIDNDFRTLVEEHPGSSLETLAEMDTDYSVVELALFRVRRWLMQARLKFTHLVRR